MGMEEIFLIVFIILETMVGLLIMSLGFSLAFEAYEGVHRIKASVTANGLLNAIAATKELRAQLLKQLLSKKLIACILAAILLNVCISTSDSKSVTVLGLVFYFFAMVISYLYVSWSLKSLK